MPALYVENVPHEIYEALRSRARHRRTSIATEVLGILEESVPTETELKARRNFMQKLRALQHATRRGRRPQASAEEMLRQDRER